MDLEISRLVSAEIRERLPPAEAERALDLLRTADIPHLPGRGRWRDRIYLGILKVADGDLRRFEEALRLAEIDWRDLLCAACLENADWPRVLARAGYRVP